VADQARFIAEQGTPVIWGEAGASGVTKTLTFEALAAGSGRMGASADLGAQWDDEYILEARIEAGSAPTAGLPIDIYLAWSSDNTNWPAGVTGSDAAWPADGNEDEWKLQLGPPAMSVISTNDGTAVQSQNPVVIRAKSRYVTVVVDNNWDQAIRDEVTATNNDSRVVLTPRRLKAIDP
jgi:hypothetical protein